jgi:hypothetical protein
MTWRPRSPANKYGAQAVDSDGYRFASKLEASVYQLLKLRQAAKEITQIECQVHVYLSLARVLYIPDFKCKLANGTEIYVEAKGLAGPRWPTIKKLWKSYGLGPLEIWKGSHLRPCLVETIVPRNKCEDGC